MPFPCTSHEIGDLITRYLALRADKLRRQAAVEQEAAAEADSARAYYEDYREANETARDTPAPPQLSPDDGGTQRGLFSHQSHRTIFSLPWYVPIYINFIALKLLYYSVLCTGGGYILRS